MAPINVSALNISTDKIVAISSDLSLEGFISGIKPLLIFVAAMTIYSIFIFKFYKFLARRDFIHLSHDSKAREGLIGHMFRGIFYVLENLILIPLVVFFWFAILSGLLLFLSKNTQPETLLLTTAAIVAAVRISAYYDENLSQDLAKMIPFALLGVFLVDISFFSVESSIAVAKQIPNMLTYMIYYLLLVVAIEFTLRIVHGITSIVIRRDYGKSIDQ